MSTIGNKTKKITLDKFHQAENPSHTHNGFKMPAIFGLLLLTSLYISNSPAEENTADQNNSQEPISATISVTATRAQQENTEVPASINTKNNEEIRLDAPTQQRELFNSIAGVRVTQTGSTIGHMTAIRMPTNTGPYYLFLQDGIPVQSSGFFNHNGLAYTNFSTADSTEVLKGAGTALYGSDSVAATINVLSIDAGNVQGVNIKPEAGSDGYRRFSINGGKTLGDTADFSAGFSHSAGDGWRDHTAFQRDELSLKHVVDLNDYNSLKTLFSFNKTEAEMAGNLIGLEEFKNNPTSVGNIEDTLNQGLEITRKFDFMRLSTEWINETHKGIEFSSIAYLRSNRNRYTATWEPSLPQNDSKTKTLGAMLKADINRDKLHYITGIDIEYTKATREYSQAFDFVPSGFGSAVAAGKIYDYEVDYYAIAPYLRTEYRPIAALKIAGGLRYDTNSYDYTNNTSDGQYADSSFARPGDDLDPTFNHLSPKLDISIVPSERQLIYARYANGFRIPQASTLYSLRTNNIAFDIDPEISDTFETGYKLATQRHELDMSIYYMIIDDTIVRRENDAQERFYLNGDKTIHQGIELSLSSTLTSEISSKVAFSYAEHKYDDDAEFGNNEQEQAPNDTANVRLIYKPKMLRGLTTMLEWEHVGSWWLDNNNTKKYNGYDIGNIKLSYRRNKNLMFFAKVNNISDVIYAESANISFGRERYTPAAPRQFFAGVEVFLGV